MISKNYLNAVQAYMDSDRFALSNFLKNRQLSSAEACLISARMYLKAKNWSRARSLLSEFYSTSRYLQAEREFLLASLESFTGKYEKAMIHNLKALTVFRDLGARWRIFITLYNLGVDCERMGLLEVALDHYREAESCVETTAQHVLILRAQACLQIKCGEKLKAQALIEAALNYLPDIPALDASTLKLIAADVYFRLDKMDVAEKLLNSLAKSKSLYHSARAKFQLVALRICSQKTTGLPLPPVTVEENKEYFHKWMVLRHLQTGDAIQAAFHWREIITLFPNLYGENFICRLSYEEQSPFIRAVRQFMNFSKPIVERPTRSKLDLLYNELLVSPTPVKREVLIEKIWNTSYDPKYNARFYKLVERLRLKGVAISNLNHCYRIN